MGKIRRILISMFALLLLGLPAGELHAEILPPPQALSVKAAANKVKLNKTKLTLVYGKTAKLKLKNAPAKVAWYSSNQKIAYCNGGTLEARAVGKATITAKCKGKKYSCKVTVTSGESSSLKKDGHYTSRKMVAEYIHKYQCLPENFITKEEAGELGWKGGSLIPYKRDACIGGNVYTDYENALEAAPGTTWYECDIDTMGALERGAKRLVYSSDGRIYYTGDHYKSFTRLY